MVKEVVKDGALGGKLDVLELCYPPLGELNTIVNELHERINSKRRYKIQKAYFSDNQF